MDDDELDQVRAKLLYQRERIADLMRERRALGLPEDLDQAATERRIEAGLMLVLAKLQEGGNGALAERLRMTHERFRAALEERDRLNAEWGDDIESADRAQRARMADEAAEEAEEEHERVLGEVRARLDDLEKSGG